MYVPNHPSVCAPIVVPDDDPIYSKAGVTCLQMIQAFTNRDKNCSTDGNRKEKVSIYKRNLIN